MDAGGLQGRTDLGVSHLLGAAHGTCTSSLLENVDVVALLPQGKTGREDVGKMAPVTVFLATLPQTSCFLWKVPGWFSEPTCLGPRVPSGTSGMPFLLVPSLHLSQAQIYQDPTKMLPPVLGRPLVFRTFRSLPTQTRPW